MQNTPKESLAPFGCLPEVGPGAYLTEPWSTTLGGEVVSEIFLGHAIYPQAPYVFTGLFDLPNRRRGKVIIKHAPSLCFQFVQNCISTNFGNDIFRKIFRFILVYKKCYFFCALYSWI